MAIISGVLIVSGFFGFILAAGIVVISIFISIFEALRFSAFESIGERRIFNQKKKMILFAVASFLLMGLGVELMPEERSSIQENTHNIVKESNTNQI